MSYWIPLHIDKATSHPQRQGLFPDPELRKHVSPLGWVHINLTGGYRWDTGAALRTNFPQLNLTPMKVAA